MPVGGGPPTQLTVGAHVLPCSDIAWSPDGSRVAFETVRNGHGQVWTVGMADRRIERFENTFMSAICSQMSWAPAARIAYLSEDHHGVRLLDPTS
jgi:Tol biopolymer transport system component